jgi:hypothetical protein
VIEEECDDLVIPLTSYVDGAVDSAGWVIQIDLARTDRELFRLAFLPILDGEPIPAHDDGDPFAGVDVPL